MSNNPPTFIDLMRLCPPYYEDLITRMTFNSNRIEGSTLTLGDTYAILWNDNKAVIHARPRELYDAINHKMALDIALRDIESPLDSSLIRRLGIQINKNVNEIDGFRRGGVIIIGSDRVFPPASEVQQLIYQLLDDYRASALETFERLSRLHIGFEHIHPFSDGNGRVGRILVFREMIASNLPPAVITSDARSEYLEMVDSKDYAGLADMLSTLSATEGQRLEQVMGAAQAETSLEKGMEYAREVGNLLEQGRCRHDYEQEHQDDDRKDPTE